MELFKKAGIISRLDQIDALKLVDNISSHLLSKGLNVYLESQLANIKGKPSQALPLSKMHVDFIITIGGDGTILKTCLSIPRPETPILAINMGRRGFLTEVAPLRALDALDKCLENKHVLEKCPKLSSTIGDEKLPDALNEVLVASKSPAKMLSLKVSKDDYPIFTLYTDGLIISTPTGSTAHSLSAGGPVLDPSLEALVLTPISPLTPTYPLVLPMKSIVQIELLKPSKAILVIDGQYQREIPKKNPIVVRKSRHQAVFIRFKEDFYKRLKKRFLLLRGE